MKTVTVPLAHKGKTRTVTVHFLDIREYDRAYKQHNVKQASEYTKAGVPVFGFRVKSDLYLCEAIPYHEMPPEVRTIFEKLLAHEIWHDFEGKHPTTIRDGFFHALRTGFDIGAYSMALRWYDREGFRPLAREVLKAAGKVV